MDLRFYIALLIGKIIALILKLKGSGATAAPGLYALNFDPNFVRKFSKKVINGAIVVSGTNGKTTTSRIIADLLSKKYKVIHNRQGSNLLRGLASTFINNSSLLGIINSDIALWESDEAVLPKIVASTNPKTVILLNLFRDQLDRYGEVESIRKSWQAMLLKLPKATHLILNEDDPGIKYLKRFAKGKVTTFGIEDTQINLPVTSNVSDIKYCPNCGSDLKFSSVFSAHIGHYQCTSCSLKRTAPTISAKNLNFKKGFKSSLDLDKLHLNLNLPGLYNIYNVLAASALAHSENISSVQQKKYLQEFSSAFGRFQKIEINGKKIIIFLIKNPTGANEVIKIISLEKNLNILAMLNDNIADGKDVSWIWDTNWEAVANNIDKMTVSGTRCWDLTNRLKYAKVKLSNNNVYKDINYSIMHSIANTNTKDTLLILPTYTALLQTQKIISKKLAKEQWHEN